MTKRGRIGVYSVLADIPLYFYLILVPIIQNALFDPHGIMEQAVSNALGILCALAALAFSAADYKKRRFKVYRGGLIVKQGIFTRSFFCIRWENVLAASICTSPFMKLFSVTRAELPASRSDKRRCSVYMDSAQGERFEQALTNGFGKRLFVLSTKSRHILLSSVLLTNPLAGAAALFPVFQAVGRAAGAKAKEELRRSLDFSQYLVLIGIQPAAAIFAYVFIALWSAGTLALFFRMYGLRCVIFENGVSVEKGLIGRRRTFIANRRIDDVTVRQTLPMKLFGIRAVYIQTAIGGRKGVIAAVVKRYPFEYTVHSLRKRL